MLPVISLTLIMKSRHLFHQKTILHCSEFIRQIELLQEKLKSVIRKLQFLNFHRLLYYMTSFKFKDVIDIIKSSSTINMAVHISTFHPPTRTGELHPYYKNDWFFRIYHNIFILSCTTFITLETKKHFKTKF